MSDIALAERIGQFLEGNWSGAKRIQGVQGGARGYLLSLAAKRAMRPMLAPGTEKLLYCGRGPG